MNSSEEQQKEQTLLLNTLVERLYTDNWLDRFDASLSLEDLVGEAGEIVASLQQIALANGAPAKHIAIWLIRQIGKETTARWKSQASHLLCPHCMIYCYKHTVRLPKSTITFYGCRHCCQSRKFLDVADKRIVVILDNQMKVKYFEQNDTLQINWLTHRGLVDFDEVRIIQATDEDVERFAVQLGNNTDHSQRVDYKDINCEIMSSCRLSRNTLRILQKTFRQVKKVTQGEEKAQSLG
ncbi:MAG: hypothetical protein GY797_16610 [Deltaproteobacteria bacterium]|nr:hypothetical protein [Deltaproteobacteria bacterium]